MVSVAVTCPTVSDEGEPADDLIGAIFHMVLDGERRPRIKRAGVLSCAV